MKNYTIKKHSGEKHLIVNDISKVNVLELYKIAMSMKIPFAIKVENGIQVWGAFVVAEFLGIKDVSTILK